jgi:hypothetical protein
LEAVNRIPHDNFYEVTFNELRSFGIVLERSREWAVVKVSTVESSGVELGSILHSINGRSIILQPYSLTIDELKGWKPPLTLGFRRLPCKSGYLKKRSSNMNSDDTSLSPYVWKSRFFKLEFGRLVYHETDDLNRSPVKVDIPLIGSSISLLDRLENSNEEKYCFRLLSGIKAFVLSAESHEDMMDWAVTLFHAIALSNGGVHVIAVEKEKMGLAPRFLLDLAAFDKKVDCAEADNNDNNRVFQDSNRKEDYNISELDSTQHNDLAIAITDRDSPCEPSAVANAVTAHDNDSSWIKPSSINTETHLDLSGVIDENMLLRSPTDRNSSGNGSSFMYSSPSAQATSSTEREREVEGMLKDAIAQKFKAKLRLAVNYALELGFNETAHKFNDLFIQAESLLDEIPVLSKGSKEEESCTTNVIEVFEETNSELISELRRVFKLYASETAKTINAVQLSGVYRLITGEKGNLFKEMQLFQM